MAKFCTNCGKPLPEGGICDCLGAAACLEATVPVAVTETAATETAASDTAATAQAPEVATQATAPEAASPEAAAFDTDSEAAAQSQPSGGVATAAPPVENAYVNKTKQAMGQFLPFLKTYFGNPAGATLTALREKNMALAVIMMLINAVATGLLLLSTLSKTMSGVGKAVKEMFGRIDVDVPFFAAFFGGVAIALVLMALSVLALFVLLKLLKVNASIRYVLICVGVNTALCTAFTLLAWLCVLVGLYQAALVVLLLGVIFWAVLGMALAIKVFGAKLTGVLTLSYTALFAIVLCLGFWINSKLVLGAAGAVKVEDVKLSDGIEAMQDRFADLDEEEIMAGLSGLLQSAMYSGMYD